VKDHRGVLPRLDHLIEVADAAFAHGTGQRAVLPPGALGADQMAADQVGRTEVIVAGHGVQRQVEPMGHVLHETGLAAAGRSLDQHWHAVAPGLLEERLFIAQRLVKRSTRQVGKLLGRVHWQYLTAAVG